MVPSDFSIFDCRRAAVCEDEGIVNLGGVPSRSIYIQWFPDRLLGWERWCVDPQTGIPMRVELAGSSVPMAKDGIATYLRIDVELWDESP